MNGLSDEVGEFVTFLARTGGSLVIFSFALIDFREVGSCGEVNLNEKASLFIEQFSLFEWWSFSTDFLDEFSSFRIFLKLISLLPEFDSCLRFVEPSNSIDS